MSDQRKLSFVSDYMEGCHPEILRRLQETNMVQSAGYGMDGFSAAAKEKIRMACGDPEECWIIFPELTLSRYHSRWRILR